MSFSKCKLISLFPKEKQVLKQNSYSSAFRQFGKRKVHFQERKMKLVHSEEKPHGLTGVMCIRQQICLLRRSLSSGRQGTERDISPRSPLPLRCGASGGRGGVSCTLLGSVASLQITDSTSLTSPHSQKFVKS